MTKFSFEVPINHLSDFDQYQEFLFMLSFLFQDSRYEAYYSCTRGSKRMTIIDNSYNELLTPNTVEEMVKVYRLYEPDMVVSPDCDSWTCEESIQKYKELMKEVPSYHILPIIRTSGELEEVCKLGCLYHAIPYENRLGMGPPVLSLGPVHFLGLNSIQEILTFQPYSLDTGIPIKLAMQGMGIREWLFKGCPHLVTIPEYFYQTLTPSQLQLAHQNINAIKLLLSEGGL